MRLSDRQPKLAERTQLAAMLEEADSKAYPLAFDEYRKVRRSSFDAISNIVILAEAILPGYLMSIINGDWPNRRDEIIEALEREDPYQDEVILKWLGSEARRYPNAFNYLVRWDALRRMALKCVRD